MEETGKSSFPDYLVPGSSQRAQHNGAPSWSGLPAKHGSSDLCGQAVCLLRWEQLSWQLPLNICIRKNWIASWASRYYSTARHCYFRRGGGHNPTQPLLGWGKRSNGCCDSESSTFFCPLWLHRVSRMVLFFKTFYLFYIGVQPVNNVVIVTGGQQGLQPYINLYLFSPKLLSHSGCLVTLSKVACAIQ